MLSLIIRLHYITMTTQQQSARYIRVLMSSYTISFPSRHNDLLHMHKTEVTQLQDIAIYTSGSLVLEIK